MIEILSIIYYRVKVISSYVFLEEYSSNERALVPGLHLIIVNNYKTIIIPNGSLNPANYIVVAQAKPQPKD